jgi:glycosyltransferase involved in cell wall biosynthesis
MAVEPLTNKHKHKHGKLNKTLVSIIMPIYNRKKFLAGAVNSIQSQIYKDWELIVVDDGSEDDSLSLIKLLTRSVKQRIVIIAQENQGPAVARNSGVEKAKGEYIAFFDSDELWKPHHLANCLHAFAEHPSLGLVYGACERVNYFTNECVQKSTFYTKGQKNNLFSISKIQEDDVHLLDQKKAIILQLSDSLDCGLQNSLLRSEVFNQLSIPNFRVGEDRLFIIMMLKYGFKMAFIDDIHVTYHIHDENISDTNNKASFKKRISSLEQLIYAKQQLENYVSLNDIELKAHKGKLADEIFWELGYSLYQASGDYKSAIFAYKKGISIGGMRMKYCKTLLFAVIKMILTK